MKSVKEAGASVPRSRRRKVVGAALSLAAVVGVGGLVQANSAQAAQLGVVFIQVDTPGWAAGWGKAWDACRAQYPQTRSIEMYGERSVNGPDGPRYSQTWACLDTP
jgi:hypothetical protein